jgi:transposase
MRVLKFGIEIGPVYHRLPNRIRAHAYICFIALILHRVMRHRLRAAVLAPNASGHAGPDFVRVLSGSVNRA